MRAVQKLRSYNTYELLLIVSFILILIKGLEYLLIGLIYPLLITLLVLSPFIYSYFKSQNNLQKTIKYWSILVLCYGTVRVFLNTIIYIDSSGVPSAAYYQFTLVYWIKSILYIILGALLLLKRKYIFTQ